MNNLFDILNSKSKFGKQYEAHIDLQNYANIKNTYKMALKFYNLLKLRMKQQ